MENKKIHIGQIVEKAFNQSGKSKKDLADAIGIYEQNMNREFKNKDWSVIKLINAGLFLNYDFGFLFKTTDMQTQNPPKILLQIEVSTEKVNDVLEAINDKSLYKILTNNK